MKYLIVGLGNYGEKYQNTRHNIGFHILDSIANSFKVEFTSQRHGFITEFKHKSRTFILVKPTTYVNLSGKAVSYWMQKAKIHHDNLLIIADDLSLPFGSIRLRPKGGDAGHNGLKSINQTLGHQNYARLRFGIGNDFGEGRQVDYVLGEWTEEENKVLPEKIRLCLDIIQAFGVIGIQRAMNQYNNK